MILNFVPATMSPTLKNCVGIRRSMLLRAKVSSTDPEEKMSGKGSWANDFNFSFVR
jgi:hypothetical protein